MKMGTNEILRDFHEAKDKFRQVKILADLNCVKSREMAQWLLDHGENPDRRYLQTGKVRAKVNSIEPEQKAEPDPLAKICNDFVADVSQAAKADAGKPRLTLVPMQIIFDVAEVREYGNRKYGDKDNWKKVEAERYREAAFRHFLRYIDDPDGVDEESGIKHRKHLECNLAFLAELEEKA